MSEGDDVCEEGGGLRWYIRSGCFHAWRQWQCASLGARCLLGVFQSVSVPVAAAQAPGMNGLFGSVPMSERKTTRAL